MAEYHGRICDTCNDIGVVSLNPESIPVTIDGVKYLIDLCKEESDISSKGIRTAIEVIKRLGTEVSEDTDAPPGRVIYYDPKGKVPEVPTSLLNASQAVTEAYLNRTPVETEGKYLDAVPVTFKPPITPTPATTQVEEKEEWTEEKIKEQIIEIKKEKEEAASPETAHTNRTLYDYFMWYKHKYSQTGKELNTRFASGSNDTGWLYQLRDGKRVSKERIDKWAGVLGLSVNDVIKMYVKGRNYKETAQLTDREYGPDDIKEED